MKSVLAPAAPVGLRPGARPTFSVVIPAFQAAATIGGAIASLRGQTLAPSEVIICDDGSSDDLEAALAPHRDFVRLIRQEHAGVSAARNALLRAARSDFVIPLDADDVYAPTRLERLAELGVARPDLDILSTDAEFVVDGSAVGRFQAANEFPVEGQLEEIFDRCFVICPAMRRERLIAIGGYDEKLHSAEDWDVCIRLIQAGARAGVVTEPLLEYRLGGASLTASRAQTLEERVYMLEKAVAAADVGPSRRAATRALDHHRARAVQQSARDAVDEGEPTARRRLLAVARTRQVPLRARLGALLATVAPSRARQLVEATLSDSTGRPVG
jgi:GT2 family glycosyltransferase